MLKTTFPLAIFAFLLYCSDLYGEEHLLRGVNIATDAPRKG